MELPEEVRKAFSEALKYAKVVTIESAHEKTMYIVAGDSPEDTNIRLSKVVKKALFTEHSVTFSDGTTQWVEDNVILDFNKEGIEMYQWDKSGNKVLCERVLYTRQKDGEVTERVLKKIYRDFTKV